MLTNRRLINFIILIRVMRTQRTFAKGWHPVHVYRQFVNHTLVFTTTNPTPPRARHTQQNPLTVALTFQDMIANGEVRNRSHLAHKIGVSRARITQLLNLLKLAPEIQQMLLDLPPDQVAHIPERKLRNLVSIAPKSRQIAAFRNIASTTARR